MAKSKEPSFSIADKVLSEGLGCEIIINSDIVNIIKINITCRIVVSESKSFFLDFVLGKKYINR